MLNRYVIHYSFVYLDIIMFVVRCKDF